MKKLDISRDLLILGLVIGLAITNNTIHIVTKQRDEAIKTAENALQTAHNWEVISKQWESASNRFEMVAKGWEADSRKSHSAFRQFEVIANDAISHLERFRAGCEKEQR